MTARDRPRLAFPQRHLNRETDRASGRSLVAAAQVPDHLPDRGGTAANAVVGPTGPGAGPDFEPMTPARVDTAATNVITPRFHGRGGSRATPVFRAAAALGPTPGALMLKTRTGRETILGHALMSRTPRLFEPNQPRWNFPGPRRFLPVAPGSLPRGELL